MMDGSNERKKKKGKVRKEKWFALDFFSIFVAIESFVGKIGTVIISWYERKWRWEIKTSFTDVALGSYDWCCCCFSCSSIISLSRHWMNEMVVLNWYLSRYFMVFYTHVAKKVNFQRGALWETPTKTRSWMEPSIIVFIALRCLTQFINKKKKEKKKTKRMNAI